MISMDIPTPIGVDNALWCARFVLRALGAPQVPSPGALMTAVDALLLEEARETLEVEVVRPLDSGAQKAVELVTKDGQELVLKVISLGSSSPDALKRAEREVELLASIDSPYVVRVASGLVELGDPVRGAAWLEEALDGSDLTSHLFTRQWTWDEAVVMGTHVATGLGAAHSKRVVHRDLSSNNVRKLADGSYKVMDFGFARHTLRSGVTIAGQPGTPGFASPEHMRSYSGVPTAASDVFATGILMYAALAATLPISTSGDLDDYVRRLSNVDVVPLVTHRPDLSADQLGLIDRCLHPQPARRFLNGLQLAAALAELT